MFECRVAFGQQPQCRAIATWNSQDPRVGDSLIMCAGTLQKIIRMWDVMRRERTGQEFGQLSRCDCVTCIHVDVRWQWLREKLGNIQIVHRSIVLRWWVQFACVGGSKKGRLSVLHFIRASEETSVSFDAAWYRPDQDVSGATYVTCLESSKQNATEFALLLRERFEIAPAHQHTQSFSACHTGVTR